MKEQIVFSADEITSALAALVYVDPNKLPNEPGIRAVAYKAQDAANRLKAGDSVDVVLSIR